MVRNVVRALISPKPDWGQCDRGLLLGAIADLVGQARSAVCYGCSATEVGGGVAPKVLQEGIETQEQPETESPAFAYYAPAVLVDPALLGSTQARNSL